MSSYYGGHCLDCESIMIDSNYTRVTICPMCGSGNIVRIQTEACPTNGVECSDKNHHPVRGDHVMLSEEG